ncbi:MAG: glycerol-3-phosphate acyltransferase [Spirochaetales bacterium]
MEILKYVVLILFSYFLGNISFARIISKKNNSDITTKGSGNPGAINMLRNYGAKLGGFTLLLDVLKGAVPAIVGFFWFGGYSDPEMATLGLYIAGFSVIIGHIYPVLLKFKGGKGIACSLGVFLVADPLVMLIVFAVSVIYLWFFEYGSITSFIMITSLTIIEGLKVQAYDNITIVLMLFGIFFMTWFAHRKNILRLLIGKENRLKLKGMFKKKNKENNP